MTSGEHQGTPNVALPVAGKTESTVTARTREAEVLRRRIAGQPYRFIAAEMGMSLAGAHDAFKRAMAATMIPVQEAADEYRAMMQERLELDLQALASKRADGDPEAIRVGLAVEKSLRELKGLDAPTVVTGDFTVKYEIAGTNMGALT